jgi:hypothetical protein
VLVRIVERVIEEAVRVGTLGPKVNRRVQVQFEELSPSPVEGVADAAEKVARALAVAQE